MLRYRWLAAATLIVCPIFAQTAPRPETSFVPSDELNAQLPSWLRFNAEFRARIEGPGGLGYRPDSNDLYLLNRFRLNMSVRPLNWLRFQFQGQDARVYRKNQRPAAPPFQDTMDLRMAFLEIGDAEKGSYALRAGRQELVYGEQRLVGHVSWLNTARSFDAIRGTLHYGGYRLDAFAASVVNIRDGEFNRFSSGNKLHGLYGGLDKLIPNGVIEPYLFWRLGPQALDSKTAGVRLAGKLPANFDYGVEMAKQVGSIATSDVGAWAGHWRMGYTIAKLRYKPRAIVEYNYATGDDDPRDSRFNTFDVLYPTPHDKYGLANQVGWKNIHHFRVGPELKPHAKWMVSANYHSWWLASRMDGIYNAIGTLIARIPSGAAGRHVGQELDTQAFYTVNKQVAVAGGFAHIFPGTFLKAATPGRSYNFPYVMVTYGF